MVAYSYARVRRKTFEIRVIDAFIYQIAVSVLWHPLVRDLNMMIHRHHSYATFLRIALPKELHAHSHLRVAFFFLV